MLLYIYGTSLDFKKIFHNCGMQILRMVMPGLPPLTVGIIYVSNAYRYSRSTKILNNILITQRQLLPQ